VPTFYFTSRYVVSSIVEAFEKVRIWESDIEDGVEGAQVAFERWKEDEEYRVRSIMETADDHHRWAGTQNMKYQEYLEKRRR
jgi:hypothetical protein